MVHQKKSPIEEAGFCSNLFFCWLLPILEEGNRDDLHCNDLHALPSQYRAERVSKFLSEAWKQELERQNCTGKAPSLLNAIRRAFGLELFVLGILLFVEVCVIKVMQPLLLGQMLHNFQGRIGTKGSYYAGALVLTLIISPLIRRPLQYNTQLLGMKLRVAASSLLYNKVLRLSLESLKITSIGQITSLIGTDVNDLDSAITSFHQLWIPPCQLLIALSIIYYCLGLASLSGVAIFLLVISIQGLMGLAYQYYCSEQAKDQDQRLGIISELLQKIRLIKMHTWEPVYEDMVNEARTSELSWIRKKIVIMAINKCLYYTSLKSTIFLTLLVYFLTGGQITAEKVYVVIAVYNNIRYPMANCFPAAIQHAAEGVTVVNRLQKFLLLDEIPIQILSKTAYRMPPSQEIVVQLENVRLKLNSENRDPFFLDDISLSLRQGELLVIVGPVGSGKSTILNLILNELIPSSGLVWTHGSIAYCSQEPWTQTGSIRSNVLFGEPFDMKRYNLAVESCALTHDFIQFPQGDQTIIGEAGISLSGGQQLRLNLLRAVYANKDVYLLDLPLSCVDSSVRRHLIDFCINGALKNKSRILVTNELQLIQSANQVLVIKEGKIEAHGTYDKLTKQGFVFEGFTQSEKSICESHEYSSGAGNRILAPQNNFQLSSLPKMKEKFKNTERSPLLKNLKKSDPVQNCSEEMGFGQVKFSVFWSYVSAGNGVFTLVFLSALWLITQTLNNFGDYWIKFWTKLHQTSIASDSSTATSSFTANLTLNSNDAKYTNTNPQIEVFAGLLGSLLAISLIKNYLFFRMTLAASRELHNEMYLSIVRTSMKFFDQNPSGRILTRFSRDISVIDSVLPNCLYETIEISLSVLGYLILIIKICPVILAPATLLLILLYFTRRYNLQTSIAVKRIESNLRSPILSHLNMTIRGLSTIRAFRREDQLRNEFRAHLDLHSKAWLGFVATTRWLGLVLDWTAVVFLTMVIGIVLISDLDGPEVGLIISSVLPLATMLQWVTRQSAELKNQLISVERVEQYSHLKPEINSSGKSTEPGTGNGEISFSNVTLEYSPGTPVLRNISFDVHSNEKIGIIGRTGAGKSSILNALFRLVDISQGEIKVEGVNIETLDLHDLRSRIGIIPQDPLLVYRKSIRENLDPFNLHTDLEIWNILEDVKLRKSVEATYGSLMNSQLSDCSVGEKQLLCFARAMLMNCKILVLDEVTSNLDPITDAIIQKIIREKTECTVLTIAHKLNTVLENDRVLVLEDGIIQEFDDPAKLLSNQESKLSYYVRESKNFS